MSPRTLAKLNRKFREFGVTDTGNLNFRWKLTSEMTFLYDSGQFEDVETECGLFVGQQRRFVMQSYADVFGKRWTLARLQPPIDERLWKAIWADRVPWPRHGEYHPVENVMLDPGREPTEEVTCMVVLCLRLHRKTTRQDVADQIAAQEARSHKEDRDRIYGEMVEDDSIFGNPNPGKGSGNTIGYTGQPLIVPATETGFTKGASAAH
ncbi:MAG: hypothetical protein QM757_26425 [Paludibaculum sp.]